MDNKKRVILILDSCYLCPYYVENSHYDCNNSMFCYYNSDNPIQITHEDMKNLSKCKLKEYIG